MLAVIHVVTKVMSFAPSVCGIEPYYVGLLKTEKGYNPQKQTREAEQVRVKQSVIGQKAVGQSKQIQRGKE